MTQPGALTRRSAFVLVLVLVLVLVSVRDRCLSDIAFLWAAFSCRAFGEVGSSRSFFTPRPRSERIQHLVSFTSQTYSRRAGTRALPKLHRGRWVKGADQAHQNRARKVGWGGGLFEFCALSEFHPRSGLAMLKGRQKCTPISVGIWLVTI